MDAVVVVGVCAVGHISRRYISAGGAHGAREHAAQVECEGLPATRGHLPPGDGRDQRRRHGARALPGAACCCGAVVALGIRCHVDCARTCHIHCGLRATWTVSVPRGRSPCHVDGLRGAVPRALDSCDLARSRAISQALDASFGGTREGQFLEKITKAFENLDADAFTEVAATFLMRQLPN